MPPNQEKFVTKEFCHEHVDQVLEGQAEIKKTITEIHRRLFVDNGGPSIQSRINQHTIYFKVIWASLGVIGGVILGVIGVLF